MYVGGFVSSPGVGCLLDGWMAGWIDTLKNEKTRFCSFFSPE